MARNPQVEKLVRDIAGLKRTVLGLKQANLGYSTIDGGAIQGANDDGDLTMIIGGQFDGTNAPAVVNGPTPPKPLMPLVTAVPGGLRVYWDGTYADAAVFAPMDFARVLVYAKPLASYTVPEPTNQAIIVGQIMTATGGEITAALDPGIEYAVYLHVWSLAGKYSPSSDVATAIPLGIPDETEIALKASIYRQTTPPWPNSPGTHTDDIGDLWFDTTLQDGPIIQVATWSRSANNVTINTVDPHGLTMGQSVNVSGVDATVDGLYAISSVTDTDTFVFVKVGANQVDIPAPDGAVIQGDQTGGPLNHAYIWDGDIWNDAQDSDIDSVTTLINGVAVQVATNTADVGLTQDQLATLAVTATDAYNQAVSADGRIAISDYEPGPDDVAGKQEGSLWITRTRDRRNLCRNPSFEVNTTEWTGNAGTLARVAVSPAADGGFAGQLTNTGVAGSHTLTYQSGAGTYGIPCEPGQTWSASVFARLVSGTGANAKISLRWMTSGGVQVGSLVDSALRTLDTSAFDESDRIWVSGSAPATAAFLQVVVDNPNASAVWQVDGGLIELSSRLGRYFDGSSEGGSWVGTAENSESTLDGNAIIKFFTLEDGNWAEKFWTADTITSLDASVIDRGSMNGGFLADSTVAVDKMVFQSVVCAENIAQGDLVNVGSVGGLFMVRRARADVYDLEATHHVLAAGTTGNLLKIYPLGYNPYITNGQPGRAFLSATSPGKVSSAPPVVVGSTIQQVGTCVNATTLNFAPGVAIKIV